MFYSQLCWIFNTAKLDRIGQQLNNTALSNECGIDIKTVNAWVSILEATYIIK